MASDEMPTERLQDSVSADAAESLWARLKPLLSITTALTRVLNWFAVAGVIGAALGFVGLVLLGFTGVWIVPAVLLTGLALVPPFLSWQGAQAFGELRELPAKLRDLGQLPERAIEEAKDLARAAVRGGSKGLLRQARPVVSELVGLVPLVASVRSFNPAVLMGIAGAAIGAAAVAFVGTVLFLLGVIL